MHKKGRFISTKYTYIAGKMGDFFAKNNINCKILASYDEENVCEFWYDATDEENAIIVEFFKKTIKEFKEVYYEL